MVALNDNLLKIMIKQKVFDHPSNEFLFGHKLVPGPEKIYVNQFRIEWAKVRKALGWPKSYQFYSLAIPASEIWPMPRASSWHATRHAILTLV